MKNNPMILKLQQALETQQNLELAVLVGSQAEGRARAESDWDIAIQWKKNLSTLENLSSTETLRRYLAKTLDIEEDLVDLINIPNTGLAMRALVAENGIPLKGENSLAWNHFLGRTWRELEYYEWEKQHAS
ncbi:MAG: nucleotidyltransferase domain-containing protein [Gammaproteobacteria bacterium]|nr:nucleotidyltransferase domain-containing protein [Gammaproteobacteria bacterium]